MNLTRHDEIALFRYEVIAPLLDVKPGGGRLGNAIKKRAKKTYDIPYSRRTRIAFGTLEEWFYLYKRGGLAALRPGYRSDIGQSRKISGDLAEEIEHLITSYPALGGRLTISELVARGLIKPGALSLSSFYRFRKARGLDNPGQGSPKDHRAFACEFPGDMWHCDLMYGPEIPTVEGGRRRVYLYAIIDDSTRVILHAQFYSDQHLRCLMDTLKQAFMKRGVPHKLYVDCGKVFMSKQLMLIAAQVGFHLIHATVRRPQGRGKMERFFRTVRARFLSRIDPDRIEDIAHLNRLLWAWIEGEYHASFHRGIKEKPLEKWMRLSDHIRPLPPEIDIERLFLYQATRRVKKDGTLTLNGNAFEAGVRFIGKKVTVRYDPFDLRRVFIDDGKEHCDAFPVDLHGNARIKRIPDPPEVKKPKPRLVSLERLCEEMEGRVKDIQAKEPEKKDEDDNEPKDRNNT